MASKPTIGLILSPHTSGCIVDTVSSSAVFDGPSVKPQAIIASVNGGAAHDYRNIFAQGGANAPFRLRFRFVSAGKPQQPTIYKQFLQTNPLFGRHILARSSRKAAALPHLLLSSLPCPSYHIQHTPPPPPPPSACSTTARCCAEQARAVPLM